MYSNVYVLVCALHVQADILLAPVQEAVQLPEGQSMAGVFGPTSRFRIPVHVYGQVKLAVQEGGTCHVYGSAPGPRLWALGTKCQGAEPVLQQKYHFAHPLGADRPLRPVQGQQLLQPTHVLYDLPQDHPASLGAGTAPVVHNMVCHDLPEVCQGLHFCKNMVCAL